MKITVVGGETTRAGYENGPQDKSKFDFPSGISLDHNGNLIIADQNNYCIRAINTSWNLSSTIFGVPAWKNGIPRIFIMDKDKSIVGVRYKDNYIRRISGDSIASIELYKQEYQGNKRINVASKLSRPRTIKPTPSGDFIIADGNAILLICNSIITDVFGEVDTCGYVDGPIENSLFDEPTDVVTMDNGIIFVTDFSNGAIRKVNTNNNTVTTFARIIHPQSIAMDENRNIFVACKHAVAQFNPNGQLVNTTGVIFGYGIAVDFTGIYFTDYHSIKKIHFIVYWKKHIHHRLSSTDKLQIKAVLLLAQKKSNYTLFHPQCILGYLPKDILMEIISKIEFYI